MGYEALSDRSVRSEIRFALEQDVGGGWLPLVTTPIIPSDQASEEYKWLGAAPALTEWVGGRTIRGMRDQGFTVSNVHYEATLEIEAKDMRRDKTGLIMQRVREMGARAQAHWAGLISTLLINGAATVCYDGQYFFDTDHSEGDSGSQSNDITVDISALPAEVHGTTTAPSPEEMAGAIMKAIAQMYGFKDDRGEPMNETASRFIVMVPPSLYIAATRAIRGTTNAAGELGIPPGLVIEIVSNGRLTSWTTTFAVIRADAETPAFLRQQENDFEIDTLGPGSDHYFKHKSWLFGTDVWRAADYAAWQSACYVTLT